jgi:CheY-like chemotaxis protein
LAAIAAAGAADFDVILMDLHMPDIDGFEATRRIRLLPNDERAQIRILAMTADLTEQSRRRCALAGIEAVVGKPLSLCILREVLEPAPPRVPVSLSADTQSPAPAGINPSLFALDALDPGGRLDEVFLASQREILGWIGLVRLARLFHRVSRQTLASLDIAVAADDRAMVGELAGVLGLVQLSDCAAAVETSAQLATDADLPLLVAALRPLRRASLDALAAAARGWPGQGDMSTATPSL